MSPAIGDVRVILNAEAGRAVQGQMQLSVTAGFHSNGVKAEILLVPKGTNPAEIARIALRDGAGVIVVAGGDGTLSSVASALMDTTAALGILPLGTLNHFAKDLNIPLEIKEAIRVIAAGNTRMVDVGEVNGRIFINNSSLGLYPNIVADREQQQRMGRGKWVALIWAALKMLRRLPAMRVRLSIGEKELARKTRFVFVGNNEYEIEGFQLGTRRQLNANCLFVYAAHAGSRLDLIWLAFNALAGRLRMSKDFDAMFVKEAWIETRRKRLRVALDGEVAVLKTPLHYRVLPGALRVIVP